MKYIISFALLLMSFSLSGMEPTSPKKVSRLLQRLQEIPAKKLKIKTVYYNSVPKDTWLFTENKDELRNGILSLLDALHVEGNTLSILLYKIRTPVYQTLLALPTHQKVKPMTVIFSEVDPEATIEPQHHTLLQDAIDVHLGPTREGTYITANWAKLQELFSTERIVEVEKEVEVEVEKEVEVVKQVKVRPAFIEKLTDPVTLATAGLVGALVWLANKK